MQWLELHNVEYGECVVLGGAHHDILMVDCGSSNQKIPEGDVDFSAYVDPSILRRYVGCTARSFLLTHYHRDHLCGLRRILEAKPDYFGRIFFPASPCDSRGKPLLLEFALFVYAFLSRQTDYSQVNISALKIFERTAKLTGANRIYALKQGDSFLFDGVTYDVLWPARENFPFTDLFASAVEDMNICLSSPFLPQCARDFMRLKEEFCAAYLACCMTAPVRQEAIARVSAILNRIDELIPQLQLLPPAPDIAEILSRPSTRTAYSDELNAASVIFQNRRTQEASLDDILMTGDATPESMDAVADFLYDSYYIIKAPHHGTASAWSHLLNEISASHILISNGDYQQGGSIAAEYVDLPAIKHCTNCAACSWYQSSGCSCNRVACCYDLPDRPGLTIKCPYCQTHRDSSARGQAPCRICVVSSGGERACLCDDKPAANNF
jgi:hypothetical protein